MTARSARADVRNPILALPAARAALAALDPAQAEALAVVLMAIRSDAADRAEQSWRKHKAPMAAYWKAASVYCGHVARAARSMIAARQQELGL